MTIRILKQCRCAVGLLMLPIVPACVVTNNFTGSPSEAIQQRMSFVSPVKRVVRDAEGRPMVVDTAHIDVESRTILYFTEIRYEGKTVRRKVSFDKNGKLVELLVLDVNDQVLHRKAIESVSPFSIKRELLRANSESDANLELSEDLLFDKAGRLRVRTVASKTSVDKKNIIEYSYDDNGALLSVRSALQLGTPFLEFVSYLRNTDGMAVAAERDSDADGSIDYFDNYYYDEDNNLIKIERRDKEKRLLSVEDFEYAKFEFPVFSPTMFAGDAYPTVREFAFDSETSLIPANIY